MACSWSLSDVFNTFYFRYTPLMEAAREGHIDMVALLLDKGKLISKPCTIPRAAQNI